MRQSIIGLPSLIILIIQILLLFYLLNAVWILVGIPLTHHLLR